MIKPHPALARGRFRTLRMLVLPVAVASSVSPLGAEAAVAFPNLDDAFTLNNEQGAGGRDYSTNSFIVTEGLKKAEAFQFQAAVAMTTDSLGADVNFGDIDIRIFAGPQETADGELPLLSTSFYSIVNDGADEFGNPIQTTTTDEGHVVILRPAGGTDLGSPNESADAVSEFSYFQLNFQSGDNEAISRIIRDADLGEELSVGFREANANVNLLTAFDGRLPGVGAFRLDGAGGFSDELGVSVKLVAVPEPSSIALLSASFVCLLRRRSKFA